MIKTTTLGELKEGDIVIQPAETKNLFNRGYVLGIRKDRGFFCVSVIRPFIHSKGSMSEGQTCAEEFDIIGDSDTFVTIMTDG